MSLSSCASGQGFTIGPSTHPAPVSQSAITRTTNLATDMYNRWVALDAQCDPRAVFAVAYLFMTHNARILIQNNYFDDGNKMADFIETFAARYVDAFDSWEAGHRANVSMPWAVYFTHCASLRSDVTQDITIGMNAHINYDLAIAAYQEGYAVSQWRDDYYRINDLMAQIDPNITYALGRYDAQFYNTDFLSLVYFQASIDFVTSWRTSAYATAIGYKNALTSITRNLLIKTSEVATAATATGLAIPYPYRTDTTRVPYCHATRYPLVL